MKKRIMSVMLTLAMVLSLLPAVTLTASAAGGENLSISTAAELKTFAGRVNDGEDFFGYTVTLTADIDLGGGGSNQWTPIGNGSNPFTGVFNGGGHMITGLYINTGSDYQGLFGYVGDDGIVENVSVSGEITTDGSPAGGIAGYSSGTVQNCYNTANIEALRDVGGIVGKNTGLVQNCYNTGNMNNTQISYMEPPAGGIVGQHDYPGVIQNCYSTGTIRATSGRNGGIAGINNGATVRDCYWTGSANGGVGREQPNQEGNEPTTENVAQKSADEFRNLASILGSEAWADGLNGYPVLRSNAETPYAEGGEYLIPTLAALESFRDYVNGGNGSGEFFKLTADLDMSSKYKAGGESWTPIGTPVNNGFKGVFDGGGHKIEKLYINASNINNVGLFGVVSGGTVQNLGVVDGSVTGTTDGTADSSFNLGGVVGYIYGNGTVKNCYNTGTVSFSGRSVNIVNIGGVAGQNSGTVESCYNTGDVSGGGSADSSDVYVGGVVGESFFDRASGTSIIRNCYNTGDVSGGSSVGGVVGFHSVSVSFSVITEIVNCYNFGTVSNGKNIGGVVGYYSPQGNDLTNCYYREGTASGGGDSNDRTGRAESITDAAFADKTTFTGAGWDFDAIWMMGAVNGKAVRPILKAIPELDTTVDDDTGDDNNSGDTGDDDNGGDTGGDNNGGNSGGTTPGADGGGSGSYDDSGPVSYPPTVSKPENGKTSVFPRNPERGDAVTVTPTPDRGYTVGGVVVRDRRGNTLEVQDNGDGTYSFIQPAGEVTIEVVFVPLSSGFGDDDTDCPSQLFADLDAGAWYHEAADYVFRNGLMNGVGDGIFGPDDTLSRAMLAQILYNAAGGVPVNYLMQYNDVPADAWYTEAVRWATGEGIVSGYDGGYKPNDPITREQLAAMLYRYAVAKGMDVSVGENTNILSYADAFDISEWAYSALQWACGSGIISGRPGGVLDPTGRATRAEAAVMLMNFLSRLDEK